MTWPDWAAMARAAGLTNDDGTPIGTTPPRPWDNPVSQAAQQFGRQLGQSAAPFGSGGNPWDNPVSQAAQQLGQNAAGIIQSIPPAIDVALGGVGKAPPTPFRDDYGNPWDNPVSRAAQQLGQNAADAIQSIPSAIDIISGGVGAAPPLARVVSGGGPERDDWYADLSSRPIPGRIPAYVPPPTTDPLALTSPTTSVPQGIAGKTATLPAVNKPPVIGVRHTDPPQFFVSKPMTGVTPTASGPANTLAPTVPGVPATQGRTSEEQGMIPLAPAPVAPVTIGRSSDEQGMIPLAPPVLAAHPTRLTQYVNEKPLDAVAMINAQYNMGTSAVSGVQARQVAAQMTPQLAKVVSEYGPGGDAALNIISQLAWFRQTEGKLGAPEAAPRDYIESWKGAYRTGKDVPLARELDDQLSANGIVPKAAHARIDTAMQLWATLQKTGSPSARAAMETPTPPTVAPAPSKAPLQPDRSAAGFEGIERLPTQDPGKSLVDTAKKQLGKRYAGPIIGESDDKRWGDPGWDCSSFVSGVYRAHGIKLTPYTDAAYGETRAVPKGQEMPGDIIFYQYSDPTQNAKYPHMGLYLGNGQTIDASYGRGVTIRNISSPSYEIRRP